MARSAQANCLNTVAAPKQARPKPRYPYIILLSLFFSDDFCRFMNRLTCPIENPTFLLPHSGHMVLIDRVTEHRADFVRVEAHIGEKHILLQHGVLPTTIGMEIMAQAVGAFAANSTCLPTISQSAQHSPPPRTFPRKTQAAWACLTANCIGLMRLTMCAACCRKTGCWRRRR